MVAKRLGRCRRCQQKFVLSPNVMSCAHNPICCTSLTAKYNTCKLDRMATLVLLRNNFDKPHRSSRKKQCVSCGKRVIANTPCSMKRHVTACPAAPKALKEALDHEARAQAKSLKGIYGVHHKFFSNFTVIGFRQSRCRACSKLIRGARTELLHHLRRCHRADCASNGAGLLGGLDCRVTSCADSVVLSDKRRHPRHKPSTSTRSVLKDTTTNRDNPSPHKRARCGTLAPWPRATKRPRVREENIAAAILCSLKDSTVL